MRTSNPKFFNQFFKFLFLILLGALVVYSVQWHEAWLKVQEAHQLITLD